MNTFNLIIIKPGNAILQQESTIASFNRTIISKKYAVFRRKTAYYKAVNSFTP